MKVRIRRKIYKRANKKLDLNRRINDRRSYLDQIKEEPRLLTDIEKRVFILEQKRRCDFMDSIIEELKAEGKW